MSSRSNELIRVKLSDAIQREIYIPDALITINEVDCSPDLQNAKIYVSILPDKFNGTALSLLRKANSRLGTYLKKNSRLRVIPRFEWIIDTRSRDAFELEEFIDMSTAEPEDGEYA